MNAADGPAGPAAVVPHRRQHRPHSGPAGRLWGPPTASPAGPLLSAIFLILAYPPFDFGLLGLVALIPWLQSLGTVPAGDCPHPIRAAWRQGYWLGVLFFGGTIWWLVHVTVVGTIALVAVLALFFAVFGAFAAWYFRVTSHQSPVTSFVLASAWALLEWLRNTLFTGFGWNLLGHTQWRSPLLQWADLVGVYGVSWLVVFVNAGCWLAWRSTKRDGSAPVPFSAAVVGLVLLTAVGYGAVRRVVVERAAARGAVLDVALVQGNIPQAKKWDADYFREIQARYEQLTSQAAKAGADLILWPETAVPGYANDPDMAAWLQRVSRGAGAPLLVGAPWATWAAPVQVFNSALLVTPGQGIVERYDKLHLVPFGEFIPGESWLPVLGGVRERLPIGQFAPGVEPTVFTLPTVPTTTLSVLICFEDVFPEISRTFVRRGARLLATITNDAWFGRTAAPVQHAQASVFRAVEHRVWMLRAANTGLTCAIDPAGRLVATVRGEGGRTLWTPGFILVPVTLGDPGTTLYTRLGDWWLLVCAVIVLLPVASRSTR